MTRTAAPLLLLVAATLGTSRPSAAADPVLEVRTDWGTLRVMTLADYDPPAAGETRPPDVAYASARFKDPLPLADPGAAEDELLVRAGAALAELRELGWVRAEAEALADLTPREAVLVTAHLSRRALPYPLAPPDLDRLPLEALMESRMGVCRHHSRLIEAAWTVIKPHVPAARDTWLTGFGDANTHSWVRASTLVPRGQGQRQSWVLIEAHLDVSAPEEDGLFADVTEGVYVERYPLDALVLDRAGLHDDGVAAYRAFAARPGGVNVAVTWLGLLLSHTEHDEIAAALDAAAEALAAIEVEQRAMTARKLPTTVEQTLEQRASILQVVAALHEAHPEVPLPDGLPPPQDWEQQRLEVRALYDEVKVFQADLELDMARLDLDRARQRLDALEQHQQAWAFRAAYGEALGRAKRLVRAHGDTATLLRLVDERQNALPGDEDAASDLANVLLRWVQERGLGTAGGDPAIVAEIEPLLPRLPRGLAETHLVLAMVARTRDDREGCRREFQAVVDACRALPEDRLDDRQRQFELHALMELAHLAVNAGDQDGVARVVGQAEPALIAAAAAVTDDETARTNLAVLWWDLAIALTIANADPALAVRLWSGYVQWRPTDPRARYGLARGQVQHALALLAADDPAAMDVAEQSVAALTVALPLDIDVPQADVLLRMAWFNLVTGFDNAGHLNEALTLARPALIALPEEAIGPVLVARTLGRMAAEAYDRVACPDADSWWDEGELLLTGLPAGSPQEDHLRGSTSLAYRTLAISVANCGDHERARRILDAGARRLASDSEIRALQDQLAR